jgi:hypothetical protein
MTKPDHSLWLTSTYDQLQADVTAVLRTAGYPKHHVRFCLYETVVDPVKFDLSDWEVRRPDFASEFARGKVQFDLGDDENGHAVLSKVYLNPTWADVLIEAENSCRGRGAPELDHVYLEAVEQDGTGAEGQAFYELIWGS